jgi:hypothetical protein
MARTGLGTLIAMAALAVAGCLGTPKLMTPGAQGVTFQLWAEAGQPPTILQADKLTQEDAVFRHLRFEGIRVRRPFDDGVVYLQAPRGQYDREPKEQVILEGPVRLSGVMGGEPFVGVGERASYVRSLGQVELVGDESEAGLKDRRRQAIVLLHGAAVRSRHFVFDNFTAPTNPGQRIKGADKSLRMSTVPYEMHGAADVPAVALALAALPHPLAIPEPAIEMK